MKYLTGRSLYYYFLMREVTEADGETWNYIAKNFSMKPKEIKLFSKALENATLSELATIGDIEMYKNYLNGFCESSAEFGKAKYELDTIDAKALALHKVLELFGDSPIKGNRLRSLSHNYERDHIASVLYALQVRYLNGGSECEKFAENILFKELKEGKNSDAGFILLSMNADGAEEIADCLKGLPDMLLRPDMQKYLKKHYGSGNGEVIFKNRRTIGFTGGGI